jgi:hypothetical protein
MAVTLALANTQGWSLVNPAEATLVPDKDKVETESAIHPMPSLLTSTTTVAVTAPDPTTVAWKVLLPEFNGTAAETIVAVAAVRMLIRDTSDPAGICAGINNS